MHLKITDAGRAALVNLPNTGTNAVTITEVGITGTGFTPGAGMAALPGEMKRLGTFGGQAVADDVLHVTIRDDSADVYQLRGFGLYLSDGTLFAVYGQADAIMEKGAASMMMLAADVQLSDIDAALVEFGGTEFLNPAATTEVVGVVELATSAETIGGEDAQRAVTSRGLRAFIDSRFGAGAPSALAKNLLAATTAAAIRLALEIKGAALKDEGQGNGLDADTVDGRHASAFADATHEHSASSITSGTFATGRIPNLPASKITSGTFATGRIPDLDAGKIASGTLGGDRIPALAISKITGLQNALNSKAASDHSHDAGDITSGTLNANRIPTLAQSKISGLQNALNSKAASDHDHDASSITSGLLPVSRGGTGQSSHTQGNYLVGNGTGGFLTRTPEQTRANIGAAPVDDPVFEGPITVHSASNSGRRIRITGPGTDAVIRANSVGLLYLEGSGVSILPGGPGVNSGGTSWDTSGNMSVSGSITPSGGFDYGSSIKLKTIDGPIPYGLSEVERMQTAIGRYRPEYNDDGRARLFFVAEQMADLVPEAVDTEGVEFQGERVAALKIEQLLPVFANAIGELSAEIRQLRAHVDGILGAG